LEKKVSTGQPKQTKHNQWYTIESEQNRQNIIALRNISEKFIF